MDFFWTLLGGGEESSLRSKVGEDKIGRKSQPGTPRVRRSPLHR